MFLFQSAQVRSAAQQAQGAGAQPLIPLEKFTPQMKKMLAAVEFAGGRLFAWVKEGSDAFERGSFKWGPNLDGCFWNRHGGISVSNYDYQWEEAGGIKAGIPFLARDLASIESDKDAWGFKNVKYVLDHFKDADARSTLVSEQEVNALFYLNYLSRVESAKGTGASFCPKHFPGGDFQIDHSHHGVVSYPQTLSELEQGFMRPFLLAIKSSAPPAGIMIGHCYFPKASQDLLAIYPDAAKGSIMPKDVLLSAPASASPLFTAYLREGLGFGGLLVVDALDMGGISGFARRKMPVITPDLDPENEQHVLMAELVLTTYAGINSPIYVSELHFDVFRKYYDSHPDFQERFDALALESLFLKAKLMPKSDRPPELEGLESLSLSDIKSPGSLQGGKKAVVEFLQASLGGKNGTKAKLDAIAASTIKAFPKNGGDFVTDSTNADIWNRGGLLDLQFRKDIIGFLSGKEFTDLGGRPADSDEEHASASKKLVRSLQIKKLGLDKIRSKMLEMEYREGGGAALLVDGKKEALALSKEEYAKAVELGRASFGEPKEFSRDHPVKGIIQAGNKAYLIYNANPTYSANDLVSEYDLADLEKGAAALRGIMEEYNRVNGTAFTIAISPAAFLKMINNRRMDIDGMFYVFSSPAQSLPAINRDIAAFNQAKKADMPPLTEAKLQSLRQEGTLKTPDWVFAMDGGKVIARQEKRSKTTDLTIYADAKGKPDNADIWEYYLYDGWLDYLHDSKEFQGEYSKIDWNGVEMRSVMEAYIQKMAKQGVAGNADGKGTAPKSDWFEPAEPQLAPGENKK